MRHCLAGGMIFNSEAVLQVSLHKPGAVWTVLLALYCFPLSSNLIRDTQLEKREPSKGQGLYPGQFVSSSPRHHTFHFLHLTE